VLGPNCLGIMRPGIGLNATFARGDARSGSLGLISQSGAVCTAMLDWAAAHGVGFSSVVSLGGSTELDFGELVDYLVNDPKTGHILLYIEGVRDARRFMSALRAAARVKPVILMKAGRHPAGTRAAVSHTGAMVGADDVFDAAVRRAGVVRAQSIGQLVAAAQALSSNVRPQGDRLAVITNGGGPGVMAADRASDLGIPLAELSGATVEALKRALPPHWSEGNPVDLIGDADAKRYRAALAACLADPGVDGVLVVLAPQAMTAPMDVTRAVIECAKASDKPLLACWMGEAQVARAPGRTALRVGTTALSYAELDVRATRIARLLRSRGAGRGQRVGLCIERGAEMLAAVLGILKAGAAYLPLDPDYPPERLAFMLADAGAPILITESTHQALGDASAFALEPMGEVSLKGIGKPVHVHAVHGMAGRMETARRSATRGE